MRLRARCRDVQKEAADSKTVQAVPKAPGRKPEPDQSNSAGIVMIWHLYAMQYIAGVAVLGIYIYIFT